MNKVRSFSGPWLFCQGRVLFKRLVGAREIVQHEDLSSIPRTHIKARWVVHACHPSMERQKLVDPSV